MKVIRKKSQRWLSILLVFIMLFSWVPTPVGATELIDSNEINQSDIERKSIQDEEKNEKEESKESSQSKNEKEDTKKESDEDSNSNSEETDEPLESDEKSKSNKSEETNKEESKDEKSSPEENKPKTKKIEEDKEEIVSEEEEKEEVENKEEEKEEEEKEEVEDRSAEIKTKVEKSVQEAIQFYKNNPPNYNDNKGSHSDYWTYSALWGAGLKDLKNDLSWKSEDASPWANHTYWSQGKETATNMSNEDAGIIIGSILLGKSPYQFGERNIVEDLVAKQKDNGSFSTPWGNPWAMIALDIMDAEYDVDKLISHTLDGQSDKGMFGDADATGWILTALAPYKNERQDVREAIELSVEYIHEYYQNENKVPGQMFATNANSTASVMMGLAAVGENLYSKKWTTEEGNLAEQLIDDYQQDNGSFWWQKESAGAVGMSTDQSVLALATVIQGESIFVQLNRHKQEQLEKKTTVSLRVEGINETIYAEKEVQVETFAENATAFDATEQALKDAEVELEARNGYISAIAGEGEATFNGWDGWQFMVNDIYSDVYPNQYEIKEGDQIVWFYGNVGDMYQGVDVADNIEKLTLIPKITISSDLYEEEEIEVKVTSTYNEYDEGFSLVGENEKTTIKDALIHFNGKTYPTNDKGIVKIPADEVKAGEYELKVTKDIENSYPRLLRQSKKVIIKEKADPELKVEGLTDGKTVNAASLTFSVTATDFKNNDIEPTVTLNEKEIKQEENGTYTVSLKNGENIIEVIARDGSREVKRVYKVTFEAQEEQQDKQTVTQSIVVSEKDNEIPLSATNTEVHEGDTAIDVLKRIAKENDIPLEINDFGWGEYVASIADVAEFDRGEQSGWMFRVNGKFSDVGASEVYLIPGDKVEWLYTLDFGKDLGATEFVPIRTQMEPVIKVENLPTEKLVRDPKHTITINAKSYFGTNIKPVVTLNGEKVKAQSNSFNKQESNDDLYVYGMEFQEGKNKLEIEAIDSGERKTIETYEYIFEREDKELEKSDPHLNIEGLKDKSTVHTPLVRFTVFAEDYLYNPLKPRIELNGKQVEYEKNGQYEVELDEGENNLVVTATDNDDRVTKQSYTLIYVKDNKDQTYKEQVNNAIIEASKYTLLNGVTTEWQAIGLERAGYSDQPEMKEYNRIFKRNAQEQITDKLGTGRLLITDVERLAIASIAIGKDPTDINGLNLIEKIYNSEQARDGSDSLTFQGNNGIVFSLIALDTKDFDVPKDATWTRHQLIEELLKNQRDDGAWSLAATSSTEEVASFDITGMALTALAPYNNSEYPKVEEAIHKAVDFLSKNQGKTGGFSDDFVGGVSSETTAQVIIGLTSNGIDPRGDQFTKKDTNLLDHLLQFQMKDGGFKHVLNDKASNPMATEQGLQALVAYDMFTNNEGRLYDFTVKREKQEEIDLGNNHPKQPGDKDKNKDKNKNKEETDDNGATIEKNDKKGKQKEEVDDRYQQGEVGNSNQQQETVESKAAQETGDKNLPKTASNMFNILLLGVVFILLGMMIYVIRRKLIENRS